MLCTAMALSLSPLSQSLLEDWQTHAPRLALQKLVHAPACTIYAQIYCITVSNKLKLCAWFKLLLLHLLRCSAKHIVCLELSIQTSPWLKSTESNSIAAAVSAHPLPSTHALLANYITGRLNGPTWTSRWLKSETLLQCRNAFSLFCLSVFRLPL